MRLPSDFLAIALRYGECVIVLSALSVLVAGDAANAQTKTVEATTAGERSEDLLLAWTELETGRHRSALERFEGALQTNPDRIEALLGRAEALSRSGAREASQEAFRQLLQVAPRDPEVRFRRGLAYYRAGEPDRAIPNLQAAVAIRPENALYRLRLGDSLYAVRDAEAALIEYQRAQSLPNAAANVVWRSIGNAHFALENFNDAADAYGEALEIDPKDGVAARYRAWARQRLGALDQALDDYDQAIALLPPDPSLWVSRGDVKRRLGDLDAAMDDYRRALRLRPDDRRAVNGIARAQIDAGKLADADTILARLLEAAGDNRALEADALFLRGGTRLLRRDYRGAEEDFRQHLQRRPRDVDAHYNRALARLGQRDYAGAVEDFEEALKLRPNEPDALYAFGRATLAIGQSERAVDAFRQAENILEEIDAIQPNQTTSGAAPIISRGLAFMALGDLDAAIADFDAVLATRPQDAEALRRKTQALLRMGRPSEALAVAQALNSARAEDPIGRVLQARALLAIGETDAARVALEQATALGGDRRLIASIEGDSWMMDARAATVEERRATALTRAIEAFNQEVEAANNGPEALLRRAKAFLALRRYEVAKADLDRAIAAAPENPDLRFARAEVLGALDRCEEAIDDYDVGLAIRGSDHAALSGRGACKWSEGAVFGALGDIFGSLF